MSDNGHPRYVQEVDPSKRALLSARPEMPGELPLGDRPGDQGAFLRRTFLSAMGLFAGAFAAGCSRSPVGHILPFNDKPEEMTPGVPLHYASICGGCAAQCGALVKTRDGRPIKIEGNDRDPATRGGLCAVGQASVLSLYDAARARGPSISGKDATFEQIDREVRAGLQKAASKGIYVVTGVDVGPTEEAAIGKVLSAYPGARRVIHDTTCALAIAAAHEKTHGSRSIPRHHIDRASVVVGIEADFLGTWLSPVAFSRQWAAARELRDLSKGAGPEGATEPAKTEPAKAERRQAHMLRHFQVEPRMTLTGSVADVRFTARPSDTVPLLAALAKAVMSEGLPPEIAGIRPPELAAEKVQRLARALLGAKGKALVLCGSPDPAAQALTNLVNHALGAYGTTIDLTGGAPLPEALSFDELLDALSKKGAGAVIFRGVNPAYDHPRGDKLGALLGGVDVSVALSDRRDETASLVKIHVATHNALESWGDTWPVRPGPADGAGDGPAVIGLRQPCCQPIFDTRGAIATWLRFAGDAADEDAFLKARWEAEVFPRAVRPGGPEAPAKGGFLKFWESSLQDGLAEISLTPPPAPAPAEPVAPPATASAEPGAPPATASAEPVGPPVPTEPVAPPPPPLPVLRPEALSPLLKGHPATAAARPATEIALYEKVGLRDGRLGNNAWLHEMPDPISKVTWSNYAVLSFDLSKEMGVIEGDMLAVTAAGKTLKLPVLVEPGVHPRVIAVAVGYGRSAAGSFADNRGENAFVFDRAAIEKEGATAAKAEGFKELAKSQTEPSQHGRDIVREISLAEHLAGAAPAKEGHAGGKRHLTMWQDHPYPGAKWQMNIDLSACTGCSACVVACQAENNIPAVGELEVGRRREMHWMRIDRYFAGDLVEPTVVHQPMMCQHCDNAPCETVCPVLATVHSSEGLNQQVYNRCVGTRYCANNCPPKVRRFNWFDYPHDDPLERMVLNPDVVVRSRGVMEKCSFCVQRISEGKARAKAEGRAVRDEDVRPACAQSCPTQAITFGNGHDPESRVAKLEADERHYRILDELNIGPAVGYLARVRNAEPEAKATSHQGKESHHG